ncbi:enoyl-CoA hydratase/isomerase family protein [Bacillus infantis]|uniref:enoyl-CoA hydratase/isomerase family protein n=1 Tax=Bacillus infantis TaxID=324767 RepID=UPI003CF6E523
MNDLYIEKAGPIASLVINRPEKKNAFTLQMFKQLSSLLDDLEQDEAARVLIVRGVDDTCFAAGADISEFLENRLSAEKAKLYNDTALEAVEKLYRFSKPTIAVIRGLAIGGGLELALACDFRFASKDSRLGITAAKLGIVYNLASTKRLADAVGISRAKELLYTGKLVNAAEAKEIGLINDWADGASALERALELAGQIAERSAVSVIGIKKVIHAIADGAVEEDETIARLILDSFSSDDYQEGIQAFLEKRKPDFSPKGGYLR